MAKSRPERWFHVTVVRSTIYKVKAKSEDEAIDNFAYEDEVDGTTLSMDGEQCDEAEEAEYEAAQKP